MQTFSLKILEKLASTKKTPLPYWKQRRKKELALYLYREGIISFVSARRLAGMWR